MNRVSVIGTSGSGKTTFAAALAKALGVPHVELDALSWGPGWTQLPTEELRSRVARIVAGDGWVVEGNYSAVRSVVWERADTVVWLDYALPLILWRLARRTIRRIVTHEPCCNGNYETLRLTLSRDSNIIWVLASHPRHKHEYPLLLGTQQQSGVQVVRLTSPRAARRWLRDVAPEPGQHV